MFVVVARRRLRAAKVVLPYPASITVQKSGVPAVEDERPRSVSGVLQ
jgi:hypothetical protein